jgi:outer membrane protein assembly factor BamE (lipoprotein component of BamABCDE complex)
VKPALLLSLAAIYLAGCFEAEPQVILGRDFPMERVPAIKRHASNKKDVEDIMGPPYRKETLPASRSRWRYYMRKEQATRILWIFPSATHVTENRLEITFDGSLVESIEKSSKNFSE